MYSMPRAFPTICTMSANILFLRRRVENAHEEKYMNVFTNAGIGFQAICAIAATNPEIIAANKKCLIVAFSKGTPNIPSRINNGITTTNIKFSINANNIKNIEDNIPKYFKRLDGVIVDPNPDSYIPN